MHKKISLVIASIYPDKIYKILNQIEKWSIKPSEIIFCFPLSFKKKVKKNLNNKKLKMVFSPKGGQVIQRQYAFRYAKHNIILQMDDDVTLKNNCLEHMYNTLIHSKGKNAIGAVVYDQNINDYLYKENSNFLLLILQKIYEGIVLGGKFKYSNMGKISKIGYCFNLNPLYMKNKVIKVDWLNSLCLSYKKDLILKNYFPFVGKALCEDLINSIERTKKGIQHLVPKNARFFMEKEQINNNLKQKLSNFFFEMKIRKFVLNKIEGNIVNFYFFVIFEFFRRAVKNVF